MPEGIEISKNTASISQLLIGMVVLFGGMIGTYVKIKEDMTSMESDHAVYKEKFDEGNVRADDLDKNFDHLKTDNAILKTRVDYLEKEVERLRNKSELKK